MLQTLEVVGFYLIGFGKSLRKNKAQNRLCKPSCGIKQGKGLHGETQTTSYTLVVPGSYVAKRATRPRRVYSNGNPATRQPLLSPDSNQQQHYSEQQLLSYGKLTATAVAQQQTGSVF